MSPPLRASVTRLRIAPTPAPRADPRVLEELAHHLEDGALHCRESRRHDWRPSRVTREAFGFRRVELCSDCESSRWQELDSRGYVLKAGVEYVEGYLNPKGTGRIGQDGQAVYRLEAITRYLPKPRKKRGA